MSRKEKERNQIVSLILEATDDIASKEGLESISIRKIASRIEYAPGTIYRYFSNKEAIIEALIIRRYSWMQQSMKQEVEDGKTPIENLSTSLRNYIRTALSVGESYIAMMMQKKDSILAHTAVLFEGVIEKKPGFQAIGNWITEITEITDVHQIEYICQIIWVSTFGLIIRITIEKPSEEQMNKLIDAHVTYHIEALRRRKK